MSIEEFSLNKQSIISRVLEQYLGDSPTNDGLVTLYDLIDQVYDGVYDQVELDELKADKSFLRDFLVNINGCYSEARIGRLSVNGEELNSSNVPSNFGDITLDTGKNDNPLLLITSSTPTSTISIEEDGKYTFLVFSDLHLDADCFRDDGTLDGDKLSERISAFEMFKNKMITELRENGTPVVGIIFTGDVLDAFTKYQSNFVVDNNRRDYLAGKVVELAKRERVGIDNDNEFVVGILGNHEMTMGTDYASCCSRMQGVVSNVFADNAKIIGAGYARIRVGDDFVSIIHSSSNDYSDEIISYTSTGTPNRDREEHFILLYQEYMSLCKKVMEDYERANPGQRAIDYFTTHLNQRGKVGNDLRNEQAKVNLFQFVNDKLKNENPELYEFYKPFITCDRDYTTDNITDKSRMFSFFEMHMTIDSSGELRPVSQFRYGSRSFEKIGFDVNGYEIYFKRNGLMSKGDGISGINPFVSRTDDYMSVLSLVGHHHRKADIDDGDLVRVTDEYLEVDRLHVTSVEQASVKERFSATSPTTRVSTGYAFEATRVTININEGQVIRIALQPEQMIVNREQNGLLVIDGTNLVRPSSKETSFNK